MIINRVLLHKRSAPGDDVNQLKILNLDHPELGDVISKSSELTTIAGGAAISIPYDMYSQEGSPNTNQTAPILFGQITESEIIDAVQNASFEMIENQVTEAAQESAVSPISENASLPKLAPLQSPKVSSSLQDTYVKEEFSDSSLSGQQDVDTNDDNDGGSADEVDDVQVLHYRLAMQDKQCNHMTCNGSCNLRQSQLGKDSPINELKNSVNESVKERDSQNSSDSVILVTKCCPEATAKEESEPTQEHTTCQTFLVSTPKKSCTKISIQNAESGANVDSKSETNSHAEAVNTTCGADKQQTVQASEGNAMTEDSVRPADRQKQFTISGLTGTDLYLCGNAHCEYRVATASQLREHLYVCDLSREGVLECPHCCQPFKAFDRLVNHLRIHGIPRYLCALCTYRATAPADVAKHLKHQHKVCCTETTPVDSFHNDCETDMFVVCPKRKGKSKHNQTGCMMKTTYQPEERHLLPMSAILKYVIQCSLCSFKTKVCSNMKRHLGSHLDPCVHSGDIPTVKVVNPVPCLEQDEKMFEKMTNLDASHNTGAPKLTSSRTSSSCGSAVTAGAANDEEKLRQQQYLVPQYVEECRRYVCSAVGCTYLSCSKAMLQLHQQVLHRDETAYHCPHCPSPAPEVPLKRMGAHLRMHGDRLYGCAHCAYFHFMRHIVERHLVDRHPGKRAFVTVLRENGAAQAETSTDLTPLGAIGILGKSGKEVKVPTSADTSQLTKRTAAPRATELLPISTRDLSEPVSRDSPISLPTGSDTEEPDQENKQAFTSSPEQKKKPASEEAKITCMDCGTKCINVRALKLHVRKNHMCTSEWLCGYCHRGRSTEMAIKQHCSVRHRGLPELTKYNEGAASLNLDDEFWETNYGLPSKTMTTAFFPSSAQQQESPLEEDDSQVKLQEMLVTEESRYCKQKGSQSTLLKYHKEYNTSKELSIVEATQHHYACSKCNFVAPVLYVLKRHFETEHHNNEFCYIVKPSKLSSDESVFVRTETGTVKHTSTRSTLCDAGNCVCMSCDARTGSEEQIHRNHLSVHHPNVEPKYSFESVDREAKRTKFECPKCFFISDNYDILKVHLECHMQSFKCGCAQHCDLESTVDRHFQSSCVDRDFSVAHIRELEVENSKRLGIERNVADESLCPAVQVSGKKGMQRVPHRIQNIALMSTALSSVSARLLIQSSSAERSEKDCTESSQSDDSSVESKYSYYGRSPSPVDENRLVTFANYGGSVIRMSLSTFSELYNIYPKVEVQDLKHEKLEPI